MDNYESFKKDVLSLTGIDLNSYKEGQMKRRIDSLISRNKLTGYNSYVNIIRTNRDKFDEFVNYLTINVSEFWRNGEQWAILEKDVLPVITKSGSVKIWSAACSTGDEPYSLVMLLRKYLDFSRIKITASDLDKQVLAAAKTGIYMEKSLKGLPAEFRTKYFKQLPNGQFEVSADLKRCITFMEHNLLSNSYPSDFDMIVCRNVLIYFTDEAKEAIYRRFYKSLKANGILFLGSTEQILHPKDYGFEPISSFFYKKI